MIPKQAQSKNYRQTCFEIFIFLFALFFMVEKSDDIFNSWRENLFPNQPKKMLELFQFFFPFPPQNSISYLHANSLTDLDVEK